MSERGQNLGKKYLREIFASRRRWSISARVRLHAGRTFQQRFAADGHRIVKFFDKKAGEIDIDFLLSRVNQPADIIIPIVTTLPRSPSRCRALSRDNLPAG